MTPNATVEGGTAELVKRLRACDDLQLIGDLCAAVGNAYLPDGRRVSEILTLPDISNIVLSITEGSEAIPDHIERAGYLSTITRRQGEVAQARSAALQEAIDYVTAVSARVQQGGSEEFPNGTRIATTTLNTVATALQNMKANPHA